MTENEIAAILSMPPTRFTAVGAWTAGIGVRVYARVRTCEARLTIAQTTSKPVFYESVRMDVGFRADLIVDDKVIVEIKSIDAIAPVHRKQLLTYLRLTDKRLGLLITSMSS